MARKSKPQESRILAADGRDRTKPGGLSRRNFVRGAVAGAAAISLGSGQAEAKSPPGAATDLPISPAKAAETWAEPWVWRPGDFPGDPLQMNVVEHQNPTSVVGFGNPGAALFTYNGSTPGPTIRMGGHETLRLNLVNHLGLNQARSPIGPAPDLAAFFPRRPAYPKEVTLKDDWCLGEHTNGIHSAHTTNIHTHGLHVRPGLNPDGTHSDDIFVRLMPPADWRERQGGTECRFLMDNEQVGKGDWEFRIGGQPAVPVHPPGTHWYHPHPHGATFNEVSSGLAGFLIVEGDVDEAINRVLTGQDAPDPAVKTGAYDYRERLMLIQRINPGIVSHDPDAANPRLRISTVPVTNGESVPPVILMRPGAIERWRLLNGSVDGKGYLRFMALKGIWVDEVLPSCSKTSRHDNSPTTLDELIRCQKQLLEVDETTGARSIPDNDEIECAKQHLYQLAQDGVTLVRKSAATEESEGKVEYFIKDLAEIPYAPNPQRNDFKDLGAVYKNAETIKAAYVRPNELYMAPANRADFLFRAPRLGDTYYGPGCGREYKHGKKGDAKPTYEVYTIVAKATAIHTDQIQRGFAVVEQDLLLKDYAQARREIGLPQNTIVAYIVVHNDDSGGSSPIPDFDIASLNRHLPEVPSYLHPIPAGEVRITNPEEARIWGFDPKKETRYRTREITYSGWGASSWPRIHPDELTAVDPDKPVGEINPVYVFDSDSGEPSAGIGELVVPPILKTMAIDGRKFDPSDPKRPRMLVDTAEEWCVYNNSITLFGEYQIGDAGACPAPPNPCVKTYRRDHSVGWPMSRAEADGMGFKVTTRGIDHPFHIHINPFWLMRLEVPDQNGNLVNILDEPRWQDTIWLPRNGGRAIFRSRFPDYIGIYVEHCHILQHEDNGMMQAVEIVPFIDDEEIKAAAYRDKPELFPAGGRIDTDYLETAYKQCTRFVDPNKIPGRAQDYPAVNGVFPPPKPPERSS